MHHMRTEWPDAQRRCLDAIGEVEGFIARDEMVFVTSQDEGWHLDPLDCLTGIALGLVRPSSTR